MNNPRKNNLETGTDENEIKQILKKRAKFYAQLRVDVHSELLLKKVAVFSLSDELYGMEVADIKEVFHLENLTPLPGTPLFLKGVVNVRGKIIPVIDLKSFFQLPDTGISDLNKVIMIENNSYGLGLLTDSIKGVEEIDFNTLEPPLPVLTDIRANYTKGLVNGIIILNALSIVNDKKLIINEK